MPWDITSGERPEDLSHAHVTSLDQSYFFICHINYMKYLYNNISCYCLSAFKHVIYVLLTFCLNTLFQYVEVVFDGSTGTLKSLKNLERNISIQLTQQLLYYKAFYGNCSKDVFQASGAYAFRPNGSELHNATGPDGKPIIPQFKQVQVIYPSHGCPKRLNVLPPSYKKNYLFPLKMV